MNIFLSCQYFAAEKWKGISEGTTEVFKSDEADFIFAKYLVQAEILILIFPMLWIKTIETMLSTDVIFIETSYFKTSIFQFPTKVKNTCRDSYHLGCMIIYQKLLKLRIGNGLHYFNNAITQN